MKFYYNNKLMRTSKNHVYTHAVINENEKCIACSSTRKGAEQVISSEISQCERSIQTSINKKIAIESGKTGFWDVHSRQKFWVKLEKDNEFHTVESSDRNIQWQKARIELVRTTWKVVELEAR